MCSLDHTSLCSSRSLDPAQQYRPTPAMSTRSRTSSSMTTSSSTMSSTASSSALYDNCTELATAVVSPATRHERRTRHHNSSSMQQQRQQQSAHTRTTASISRRTAAIAVAALSLCCAPAYAQQMNNVTSLTGTWSTGYGAVMTGPVSRYKTSVLPPSR